MTSMGQAARVVITHYLLCMHVCNFCFVCSHWWYIISAVHTNVSHCTSRSFSCHVCVEVYIAHTKLQQEKYFQTTILLTLRCKVFLNFHTWCLFLDINKSLLRTISKRAGPHETGCQGIMGLVSRSSCNWLPGRHVIGFQVMWLAFRSSCNWLPDRYVISFHLISIVNKLERLYFWIHFATKCQELFLFPLYERLT